MPRLKSSNFAVTELTADITGSVTSFTVTDASSFPDVGPFMILVHDNTPGFGGVREIMEVGSINKATNTFSDVLRGREGTIAQAHSAGSRVEGVWTAGTHQELVGIAELDLLLHANAGAHNSIYRGKYLGSLVTEAQYTAISNGTFEDLYIGDYWTIGGVNYRIAAFNYYYNCGDTALQVNHVTLVPDTILYSHVMNDTNTTTGGYTGSKMYTAGLTQAKNTIKSAFPNHVVNHRQLLCNAVIDGKASGWTWLDSEVELMNEIMVYGSIVFSSGGYNTGIDKSQLPLFALRPDAINFRQAYWLRDVTTATSFANVYYNGYATYYGASYSLGVRPAFSIS